MHFNIQQCTDRLWGNSIKNSPISTTSTWAVYHRWWYAVSREKVRDPSLRELHQSPLPLPESPSSESPSPPNPLQLLPLLYRGSKPPFSPLTRPHISLTRKETIVIVIIIVYNSPSHLLSPHIVIHTSRPAANEHITTTTFCGCLFFYQRKTSDFWRCFTPMPF